MSVAKVLTVGMLVAGIALVGWIWLRKGEGLVPLPAQMAAPGRAAGFLRPHDAALVALGRQIYARACANCHGVNLEGQAGWRTNPRLAPAHDASGHTWHHPDALLLQVVRAGTMGKGGAMPGFGDVLSEREILAVLSYIKSRWPERIREAHDAINARAAGSG